MDGLFKALGVLLAMYVAYSLVSGTVTAKKGIAWATYTRGEEPARYWSVWIIYLVLSILLLVWF